MQTRHTMIALVVLAVTLAWGCASEDSESTNSGGLSDWEPTTGSQIECTSDSDCASHQYCDLTSYSCVSKIVDNQDPGVTPGGTELEFSFEAPQATEHFVFIPSKDNDLVVKLDAATLKVSSIEVGEEPTTIATIPQDDTAIILDYLSADVAIIRASPGDDEVSFLPILEWSNSLVVSPHGPFAAAFYDYSKAVSGDPVGSLQAVTILDLRADSAIAVDVSCGFNPTDVYFSSDDTKAFIVTDSGISTVDLTDLEDAAFTPPVPYSETPILTEQEREVLVTPSGDYAVARVYGAQSVSVTELATKEIVTIPLAAEPTDVDLLPDGSAAVVTVRDAGVVLVLPIPAIMEDQTSATVVETDPLVLGSAELSADGSLAVLFTTIDDEAKYVALLHLDAEEITLEPVALQKSVRGVTISPGGDYAMIFNKKLAGVPDPTGDLELFIDRSYGYTIIDLETGAKFLKLTDVEPTDFTFATGLDAAFVLLPDTPEEGHLAQHVDLKSFLFYDYTIDYPPLFVRSLPDSTKVAVVEEHTAGKVTFIDIDTASASTITGFQLNDLIQ